MLRIVHISDLHIRHPSVNNDTESVLQTGVRIVLQRHGITIEAGGHDDSKLTLLKASVASLKPHVIVVTGDLTNFGDQPSFKMAGEFLSALKAESGATQLFCVPGNHDCLVERAAALQQTGGKVKRLFLKVIGQGNRETQVMQQAAAQQYSLDGEKPSPTALLLENYMRLCDEKGFGRCHPAMPVQVDAHWGWVSFFPFNSVNGPGLMANKGAIGDRQLATFSSYAQGKDWPAHARAVRIALLHHHPISAPQSRDTDINRGYDWMDDGPRLLKLLNDRAFHFVLHGHQHEPFTCAVDYGESRQRQTLIVAAGSATQGGMAKAHNSFNVIDLLNPFEARVRRFDLADAGFASNPAAERVYPLRAIDDIRLSDSAGPLNEHDVALRSLVQNSFRDFESAGEAFDYDELDFDVVIDTAQLYTGRYRRRGRLVDPSGQDGLIFTITGSPAMRREDMALTGWDMSAPAGAQQLAPPEVLVNDPKRKVIRVRPRHALHVGDSFNLALGFRWQASEQEQNTFDAVSLMGLRHPVKTLRYSVCVPWQAATLKLQSIGTVMEQVGNIRPTETQPAPGQWNYAFEVQNPPPMAYVIRFSPD